MKYIIILLSLLIFSGCETSKPMEATSTTLIQPTTTPGAKKENIIFEVSSFSLKYEKSTDSRFSDEKYDGSGIITTTGDIELIKKPYEVLLKITKTSGGDKRNSDTGLHTIIVNDGIGKFTTSDWNYEKDFKMEKPVYEIKILGYLPFREMQTK